MKTCLGCGELSTADWFGDAWCDPCGGVMGLKNFLIFRHVATLHGAGARLPVVWDESGQYYKFRHPTRVNPRFEQKMLEVIKRKKLGLEPRKSVEAEFDAGPILTISHKSLDAVLTIAQPIAKGGSEEWPELSAAPSATESERSIMRV